MKVLSIQLRKFLIRFLAQDMGVVLNASLGIDKETNEPYIAYPYIAYAGTKGGMCDLSGVK